MHRPMIPALGLAALAGIASQAAMAIEGYVTTPSGEIVKNGFDECVHTGFWRPSDAVVGCDGKVAAVVAPEVVAVVPVPVPKSIDQLVYFAFDSADLQVAAVDEINGTMAKIPGGAAVESVVITGYTDPIGTEAYNQALSERRAQAVQRYLVDERGVEAGVVATRGRGESDLVETCGGERGAALISCLEPNRRAEIEVQLK